MIPIILSNQEEFEKYLSTIKGLSISSIAKYAQQSHNRIQRDLGISFYAVDSMTDLHQLLQDVKVLEQQMEKDPRRMYSSAVSNFIKFKAYQVENEYLIDENSYLNDIEKELALGELKNGQPKIVEPKPPAKLKMQSTQIYQRDRRVAAEAIRRNHFMCQIDSNHAWFHSKATNKNYVEAHHIIPISTQALFEYSIDCTPNIASLCPVCHRQIHYGYKSDKIKLLEILWDRNKNDIEQAGIDIKLKEVVDMY